mmetsp:Transcript_129275/g.322229  ORF Transcript_129275/g.322229 Transcript_129275/m.322229 type:complete len:85 (-) Transcript_129275:339-593(-)
MGGSDGRCLPFFGHLIAPEADGGELAWPPGGARPSRVISSRVKTTGQDEGASANTSSVNVTVNKARYLRLLHPDSDLCNPESSR